MFGERYFATRGRFAELVGGIAELAAETVTDLDSHVPLTEIQAGLNAPLRVVVCGEVNAGKSTLLNGLCGHDLCPVSVLPETKQVRWYRHGETARTIEVSPLLAECHRPLEFLWHVNLVDTPGTNSVVQGHQEITARFLPTADLILYVFPVANPWGATTWDAISRLPAEALARVAIILQQADQRDANDLQVILGHMADLAMKRIGQVPPIFAVSGKLAHEARRASPVARDHLVASGFPALEKFISTSICQSISRRHEMESWRTQAGTALRALDERIEEQIRAADTQSRFIEQLEHEIDDIRQQFVTRLPRHLSGVAEVFESEGIQVTKLLRRRMAAMPSILRLFIGDRTGPDMETAFIERLQAAVEAVAHQDGGEVAAACQSHWTGLGQRVKAAMAVDLEAATPIDQTLSTARLRFVQRLGHAARAGVGNLKVRNQLDKELRRRNRSLKSFVSMTLILTIIGASCGALNVPWLPAVCCGFAALFLTGGVLAAWATRRTITGDFQSRLLDTCGTFASTLHADYEEALRIVFHDYAAALGNVRTHLAREKLAIEPRMRRWQELFLTLKALEQEL